MTLERVRRLLRREPLREHCLRVRPCAARNGLVLERQSRDAACSRSRSTSRGRGPHRRPSTRRTPGAATSPMSSRLPSSRRRTRRGRRAARTRRRAARRERPFHARAWGRRRFSVTCHLRPFFGSQTSIIARSAFEEKGLEMSPRGGDTRHLARATLDDLVRAAPRLLRWISRPYGWASRALWSLAWSPSPPADRRGRGVLRAPRARRDGSAAIAALGDAPAGRDGVLAPGPRVPRPGRRSDRDVVRALARDDAAVLRPWRRDAAVRARRHVRVHPCVHDRLLGGGGRVVREAAGGDGRGSRCSPPTGR